MGINLHGNDWSVIIFYCIAFQYIAALNPAEVTDDLVGPDQQRLQPALMIISNSPKLSKNSGIDREPLRNPGEILVSKSRLSLL